MTMPFVRGRRQWRERPNGVSGIFQTDAALLRRRAGDDCLRCHATKAATSCRRRTRRRLTKRRTGRRVTAIVTSPVYAYRLAPVDSILSPSIDGSESDVRAVTGWTPPARGYGY